MNAIDHYKKELETVEKKVVDKVGIKKGKHFKSLMNGLYDYMIDASYELERLAKNAEL